MTKWSTRHIVATERDVYRLTFTIRVFRVTVADGLAKFISDEVFVYYWTINKFDHYRPNDCTSIQFYILHY